MEKILIILLFVLACSGRYDNPLDPVNLEKLPESYVSFSTNNDVSTAAKVIDCNTVISAELGIDYDYWPSYSQYTNNVDWYKFYSVVGNEYKIILSCKEYKTLYINLYDSSLNLISALYTTKEYIYFKFNSTTSSNYLEIKYIPSQSVNYESMDYRFAILTS